MRSARLLIVEDNSLNMELVSDLLEWAGYRVDQATTAEEAIAVARAEPPDLILMDIHLSGMDGLTAVGVLKGDSRTRAIPVVALTAQAMTGDRQQALEAGFDGYIAKPIDTRELPRMVARYLEESMS